MAVKGIDPWAMKAYQAAAEVRRDPVIRALYERTGVKPGGGAENTLASVNNSLSQALGKPSAGNGPQAPASGGAPDFSALAGNPAAMMQMMWMALMQILSRFFTSVNDRMNDLEDRLGGTATGGGQRGRQQNPEQQSGDALNTLA